MLRILKVPSSNYRPMTGNHELYLFSSATPDKCRLKISNRHPNFFKQIIMTIIITIIIIIIIQFFIIYVPSPQLQGQLQTQHSVVLHYGAIQHKIKDKLQASTGEKTY
jgi:hypothetical protein